MTSLLLCMGLLGLITFLYRYSFVSAPGKRIAEKIPPAFLHLLAPATFAAIVGNSLVHQISSPAELQRKGIVALLSLVVAYFSRSMFFTMLFGLVLLYFFPI